VCQPWAEVPEQVALELDAALRVGSFSRGSARNLAKELLQLDPQERRWAIEFAQPELRRLAIARVLLRKAEAALEDRPRDCEEAADLAAVVAGAIDSDKAFAVRRTGAMASWLLGTAILRQLSSCGGGEGEDETPEPAAAESIAAEAAADWELLKRAAVAFMQVLSFESLERSWERALASAGLAKVRWLQGNHLEASGLFATATRLFASVKAEEPVVACQVLHGFLLLGTGDRMLARLELARVERRLDAAGSPTLATIVTVGLACCEVGNASARLAQARVLWQRTTQPASSAIPAAWQEILPWDEPPRLAVPGPAPEAAAELSDRVSLVLLAGSPWHSSYPEKLVILADRLLLGRREKGGLTGDHA
jgi:hypothetical protein